MKRAIRSLVWLYGRALRLYPRAYRQAYHVPPDPPPSLGRSRLSLSFATSSRGAAPRASMEAIGPEMSFRYVVANIVSWAASMA